MRMRMRMGRWLSCFGERGGARAREAGAEALGCEDTPKFQAALSPPTSLALSSWKKVDRNSLALLETPSIRSNLTPTPRRVRFAGSLAAGDGDDDDFDIMAEAARSTGVARLSRSAPCSPLPFHQTSELFINSHFLSSEYETEIESVRRAFGSNPPSVAEDVSSSGSSSPPRLQTGDRGWSQDRHKLQNGLNRELKRCNTPVGARGYLESATARLKRRLGRLNLRLRSTQGDGNCQFRAISFQLLGTEDLHDMVRERSVSYLDENRAAYEEFLGGREKFDEYLANMRRDKTWGDEMTLCGACNAFECVINVITSEAGNWYLQYWPRQDEDEEGEAKGKKEIFIGYTYPLHYDAVAGEGIEDTPLTPQ